MKRTFILIISALLAIQTVGCQSAPAVDEVTETTGETTSRAESTTLSPNLEAENYDGYEFTIIARESNGQDISNVDFYAEEMTGDNLNDTIFERNLKIENKYNIKIKTEFFKLEDYVSTFRNSVLAGDDEYDLAELDVCSAFTSGLQGLLCKIGDLQYINPSMPWWNQNVLPETVVDGNNYFLIGSANLIAFDSVGVLFFNKELAAENKIDDLYELVYNGSWTFDNMLKYCLDVSRDLDGNGVYDEKDMYGLAMNSYGALTFTYGTGVRFADPEDNLKISFDERFLSFFEKLAALPLENSVMYGEKYGSNRAAYMKSAFEENRVLFYNEMLNRTSMLRNMGSDFGILPMPKGDESQEEYTSFCHQSNSTTICVPITASDTDRTSKIIEDLTYESMLTVYPTYIETNVKTKYLRDEDSPKMVDIIINGIHFDIALCSQSTLMGDLRSMLTSSSTSISSTLAANATAYNETLRQLIESNT